MRKMERLYSTRDPSAFAFSQKLVPNAILSFRSSDWIYYFCWFARRYEDFQEKRLINVSIKKDSFFPAVENPESKNDRKRGQEN